MTKVIVINKCSECPESDSVREFFCDALNEQRPLPNNGKCEPPDWCPLDDQ